MVYAYLAKSYPYDAPSANNSSTRSITGGVIELKARGDVFYHESPVDLNVRVVDFIVDRNENVKTVEICVYDYDPPFVPDGRRMRRLTATSPYKYSFDVPTTDEPDFKWGISDLMGAGLPSPGYTLRVTVKRK